MQLLDHVSITVKNLDQAKPFYKAVMSALGAVVAYEESDAIGFGERNGPGSSCNTYLSIFDSPASIADPRRHYCFQARSVEQVKAFHASGITAGGSDAGAPGKRDYHALYYAAFLFDPEGNKIEAAFHGDKTQ